MDPFYGWGIALRVQSHNKETVYFLPLSPQGFPLLVLSTSEELKAKFTLKSSSDFEPGAPELGIHCLSRQTIAPLNERTFLKKKQNFEKVVRSSEFYRT